MEPKLRINIPIVPTAAIVIAVAILIISIIVYGGLKKDKNTNTAQVQATNQMSVENQNNPTVNNTNNEKKESSVSDKTYAALEDFQKNIQDKKKITVEDYEVFAEQIIGLEIEEADITITVYRDNSEEIDSDEIFSYIFNGEDYELESGDTVSMNLVYGRTDQGVSFVISK